MNSFRVCQNHMFLAYIGHRQAPAEVRRNLGQRVVEALGLELETSCSQSKSREPRPLETTGLGAHQRCGWVWENVPGCTRGHYIFRYSLPNGVGRLQCT
jgi:hypothetical protein